MSFKNKNTPNTNNGDPSKAKRIIAAAGATLAIAAGSGGASEAPPEPTGTDVAAASFEDGHDGLIAQDLPPLGAIDDAEVEALNSMGENEATEVPALANEEGQANNAIEAMRDQERVLSAESGISEQQPEPIPDEPSNVSDDVVAVPLKGGPEDLVGTPYELDSSDNNEDSPTQGSPEDAGIPIKGGPEDLVGTPYELDSSQ